MKSKGVCHFVLRIQVWTTAWVLKLDTFLPCSQFPLGVVKMNKSVNVVADCLNT